MSATLLFVLFFATAGCPFGMPSSSITNNDDEGVPDDIIRTFTKPSCSASFTPLCGYDHFTQNAQNYGL